MKYLMRYESSPESRAEASLYIDEHRARQRDFHRRGLLLMRGPLTDGDGEALGIFTTRQAALDFVAGDPFVVNGVVTSWSVREWNEVLAP